MISMKHLGKHRWWTSDCDFATVVFVLSSFSRIKTNALGLNVFASPPKNHGLFWTFLVLCLWWPSNSPKDFLVYHERNKSRVSKKSNNASKCLHGCPPGVNFLSSTETSIRQSAGWTPWDLDALRKKLTARQFPVFELNARSSSLRGYTSPASQTMRCCVFLLREDTGKKDRFVGCNLQGKQLRRDSYSYTLNVPNAQGFM